MMTRHYDRMSSDEHATRRALAYLCSSVSGFREQPLADRVAFLEGLGLPTPAAEHVVHLFDGIFAGTHPTFEEVLPERCPIPWRPTVLTPVFHGYEDIDLAPVFEPVIAGGSPFHVPGPFGEPPVPVRIFYPALSATTQNAPMLRGCGRYPLVIFLHGQCPDGPATHYKEWYHLPQQLARSGYVVLVPKLDLTNPFNDVHLNLTRGLLTGLRRTWSQRDQLAPTTGIVGHSFGALLGARLALRIQPEAYVSLSGEWAESSALPPPDPLPALNTPCMFMFGTGDDLDANLEAGGLFEKVKPTKHKIAFAGGAHFDYLPHKIDSSCGQGADVACDLVRLLAADFTALFFTRYMPPPLLAIPGIPANLLPPAVDLTPQQQFYAGSMLVGLSLVRGARECGLTHSWFLENGTSGSLTLP